MYWEDSNFNTEINNLKQFYEVSMRKRGFYEIHPKYEIMFEDNPKLLIFDYDGEYEYNIKSFSGWGEMETKIWDPLESLSLNDNSRQSSKNLKFKNFAQKPKSRYFTGINQPMELFSLKFNSNQKFNFEDIKLLKRKKKTNRTNSKIFTEDIIKFSKSSNENENFSSSSDNENFLTENINSLNCKFCNSFNHLSSLCNFKTCLRCNSKEHNTSSCPRPIKFNKCETCEATGHLKEDCLVKPLQLTSQDLNKLKCFICNKYGHLICPFEFNFKLQLDSDDENEIMIVEKTSKSCLKCGGSNLHSTKNCKQAINVNIRKEKDLKYFKNESKLANDKNFMNFSDNDCD